MGSAGFGLARPGKYRTVIGCNLEHQQGLEKLHSSAIFVGCGHGMLGLVRTAAWPRLEDDGTGCRVQPRLPGLGLAEAEPAQSGNVTSVTQSVLTQPHLVASGELIPCQQRVSVVTMIIGACAAPETNTNKFDNCNCQVAIDSDVISDVIE